MMILRLVYFFPAAAWGLQAFTTSRDGACQQGRRVKRGECTKLLAPTLLFIGQAHSGSTSLSELMELHPSLAVGDMKEHHFFDDGVKHSHKRSAHSWSEYLEQFCVHCDTTVAFDATMEYINLAHTGPQMVENIRDRLGQDIKIMMMFRDPVDLLFSNSCNTGADRPFSYKDPPNISKKDTIRVTDPLSVWQQVFPNKNNWLFLRSEEFFGNPQKVLDKVFSFLEVEPFEAPMNQTDEEGNLYQNSGRRRCTMKATSKERDSYFSVKDNVEDKNRLEKLTGLKFGWKRQ